MVAGRQSGFSLLEVLLAFALLAIVLSSASAVMTYAQLYEIEGLNQRRALFIVRGELQKALSLPVEQTNAAYVIDGVNVERVIKPLTRLVSEVVLTGKWVNSRNVEQSVVLSSVIPDYSHARGEETCAVYFSTAWQEPRIVAQVQLPAEATDVDVVDGYAYVTVDDSIAATPDLFVVDVHDSVNPSIVGSLSTGPGLAGVHVVGAVAYVASISTVSQLQLIDISNTAQPVLLTSYRIPNIIDTSIAGQSIYVIDNLVYLGLTKVSGAELHVIDVSNPLMPQAVGAYETDTKINAIFVHDGVAYVATPNEEQLRILDVRNPAAITQMQSFSASGYQSQDGRSLEILGSQILLGRTVGGFNNTSNHELFNLLSSSSAIASQSSVDLAHSSRALFFRTPYVFVGTNDASKEFQILKISSNGTLTPNSFLNLGASVTALDCENEHLFASLEAGQGLVIIGSIL